VVGWPLVWSFRRNHANAISSKESYEQQNDEACDKAKQTCMRTPLIKKDRIREQGQIAKKGLTTTIHLTSMIKKCNKKSQFQEKTI
jgi:hypothetical protein